MHPDEQARLTKLAVTPNPVQVDNFVAPQPHIDWRELPPTDPITLLRDRILYLERRTAVQANRMDQLEDVLIQAGLMADTRP